MAGRITSIMRNKRETLRLIIPIDNEKFSSSVSNNHAETFRSDVSDSRKSFLSRIVGIRLIIDNVHSAVLLFA